MHVNDLLETTDLSPTFLQVPPALVAAFTGVRGSDKKSENIDKNAISLLFINYATFSTLTTSPKLPDSIIVTL